MKFTDSLWKSIEEIYDKILEHPFISGLTDGSLSEQAFFSTWFRMLSTSEISPADSPFWEPKPQRISG